MGFIDFGVLISTMEKTIYNKNYRKLLKKMRLARLEQELTQQEVAKKMGWSTNTISKLEKGDRRIDILEFAELIKIYKKPVDYFFKELIK